MCDKSALLHDNRSNRPANYKLGEEAERLNFEINKNFGS